MQTFAPLLPAMNPTRPPVPPHPSRASSNDAVPIPLYGMHINAAVASPSTHRVHPRSNSSPTSLYPLPLAQQSRVPQPPPLLPKPAALASPLPPSLMPGSAGRSRAGVLSSLESTLFFQSTTTPLASPSNSPTSFVPHPYAQATASLSKPVLPPKPRLQTTASVAPSSGRMVPAVPPKQFKQFSASDSENTPAAIPMCPISPDDNELVARALELSLQDSRSPVPSDLEDVILARVLEESLASINSSTAHDTRAPSNTSSPRQLEINASSEPLSASSSSQSSSSPSFIDTPATSTFSYSAGIELVDQCKVRPTSACIDLDELAKEEELARAEEEARRKQLETDEEFARSIALLEANSTPISPSPTHSSASTGISSGIFLCPSSDHVSETPLYSAALNAGRQSSFHVASSSQQKSPISHVSRPPPLVFESRPLPAPKGNPSLGRGYSSYSAGPPPEPIGPALDKLGRNISAQAAFPALTEQISTSSSTATHRPSVPLSDTLIPVQHRYNAGSPDGSPSTPKGRPMQGLEGLKHTSNARKYIELPPPEEAAEDDLSATELSPISAVSEEEREERRMVSKPALSAPIVEDELLMGVSFGFNAPPMTLGHEPMQGPIPDIITLPYGKCPPLHMQAPSWRHLLKLLTRLSDSRIEPTVEALAGTKSDLKLRTVIQFMKVHHSSNDWRTIVYLTIDTPIPPSTPNVFKYTNGDVNTLPYSYSISPIPALLRAGAGDSNLSKCFTVPSTANTPYPTLPMSLPDFAMYLHAVLEDSRRAATDASGGLRKLAKMMETFYPASTDGLEGVGPELIGPDRRGVGGFFRRALGRGNKDSQNQRGGNAERFEFITPFRIDEYR